MKYTSIIGILLIAIGLISSFIGKIEFGNLITEPEFALGLLYGGGFGLLSGGFLGWLYKKPYAKKQTEETPLNDKTTEIQ
ncbi:MAG: hypothetical protein RBT46_02695 [Weeksellaceae bacterium]|jgi:hypothetical protein|nr:hypothetical protein [Weeksellaceae bacterium]MDX9704598.1 hypothetical protein [Weeksellaceae bacterium]